MAQAIKNTGHPIKLAIDNNGNSNVQNWAPAIGAVSWTTSMDLVIKKIPKHG